MCFRFTSLPLPNSPPPAADSAPPQGGTDGEAGDNAASSDFVKLAVLFVAVDFEGVEGEDLAAAAFPVAEDGEDNLGDGGAAAEASAFAEEKKGEIKN